MLLIHISVVEQNPNINIEKTKVKPRKKNPIESKTPLLRFIISV